MADYEGVDVAEVTEMAVPRRVSDNNGIWQVIHPFTERVEFRTSDEYLAREAGRQYDRHDPVSMKWLIEEMYQLHPSARMFAEWVVSPSVLVILRTIKDPSGYHLWQPAMAPGIPDHLLGKPVWVEEEAVGISLRTRG